MSETMTKPKKLTDAMRDVLALIVANPDARLVQDFRNGWLLKRTIKPATARSWAEYEWVGHPATLTMDALIRRGLLEVKVPRTTPGLYDVTAFLTDAGREALSVATPEPRAR